MAASQQLSVPGFTFAPENVSPRRHTNMVEPVLFRRDQAKFDGGDMSWEDGLREIEAFDWSATNMSGEDSLHISVPADAGVAPGSCAVIDPLESGNEAVTPGRLEDMATQCINTLQIPESGSGSQEPQTMTGHTENQVPSDATIPFIRMSSPANLNETASTRQPGADRSDNSEDDGTIEDVADVRNSHAQPTRKLVFDLDDDVRDPHSSSEGSTHSTRNEAGDIHVSSMILTPTDTEGRTETVLGGGSDGTSSKSCESLPAQVPRQATPPRGLTSLPRIETTKIPLSNEPTRTSLEAEEGFRPEVALPGKHQPYANLLNAVPEDGDTIHSRSERETIHSFTDLEASPSHLIESHLTPSQIDTSTPKPPGTQAAKAELHDSEYVSVDWPIDPSLESLSVQQYSSLDMAKKEEVVDGDAKLGLTEGSREDQDSASKGYDSSVNLKKDSTARQWTRHQEEDDLLLRYDAMPKDTMGDSTSNNVVDTPIPDCDQAMSDSFKGVENQVSFEDKGDTKGLVSKDNMTMSNLGDQDQGSTTLVQNIGNIWPSSGVKGTPSAVPQDDPPYRQHAKVTDVSTFSGVASILGRGHLDDALSSTQVSGAVDRQVPPTATATVIDQDQSHPGISTSDLASASGVSERSESSSTGVPKQNIVSHAGDAKAQISEASAIDVHREPATDVSRRLRSSSQHVIPADDALHYTPKAQSDAQSQDDMGQEITKAKVKARSKANPKLKPASQLKRPRSKVPKNPSSNKRNDKDYKPNDSEDSEDWAPKKKRARSSASGRGRGRGRGRSRGKMGLDGVESGMDVDLEDSEDEDEGEENEATEEIIIHEDEDGDDEVEVADEKCDEENRDRHPVRGSSPASSSSSEDKENSLVSENSQPISTAPRPSEATARATGPVPAPALSKEIQTRAKTRARNSNALQLEHKDVDDAIDVATPGDPSKQYVEDLEIESPPDLTQQDIEGETRKDREISRTEDGTVAVDHEDDNEAFETATKHSPAEPTISKVEITDQTEESSHRENQAREHKRNHEPSQNRHIRPLTPRAAIPPAPSPPNRPTRRTSAAVIIPARIPDPNTGCTSNSAQSTSQRSFTPTDLEPRWGKRTTRSETKRETLNTSNPNVEIKAAEPVKANGKSAKSAAKAKGNAGQGEANGKGKATPVRGDRTTPQTPATVPKRGARAQAGKTIKVDGPRSAVPAKRKRGSLGVEIGAGQDRDRDQEAVTPVPKKAKGKAKETSVPRAKGKGNVAVDVGSKGTERRVTRRASAGAASGPVEDSGRKLRSGRVSLGL